MDCMQLVSFDDKMVSQGWHDPVIANNNLDLDYSIGRFWLLTPSMKATKRSFLILCYYLGSVRSAFRQC